MSFSISCLADWTEQQELAQVTFPFVFSKPRSTSIALEAGEAEGATKAFKAPEVLAAGGNDDDDEIRGSNGFTSSCEVFVALLRA